MSPERWSKLEELYHAARELAPDERNAFLASGCRGDDELKRRIEVLLAQDSNGRILDGPASEFLKSICPGDRLGHYEIIALIGSGGMGEVYKARDPRLRRDVALKVLPSALSRDPARRLRFVQEARAASALNHPHIVTIYEIDREADCDFIAMELVTGRTLDAVIGRGLRLADTLKFAIQTADALAAAHRAGITHRDLKPSNVMVTHSGSVKVLDFGLAKLAQSAASEDGETRTLDAAAPPLTDRGAIIGTVAYMSPEQAEGRTVDSRTDIFSFGSLLYEMVTGRRAFQCDTKMSTISSILRDDPKPLSRSGAQAPRDLEKIVARCLRKDPARRFQHMDDLKVALEELKEDEPVWIAEDLDRVRTESTAGSRSISKKLWPWLAMASGLIVSGALGWWWRPIVERPSLELTLPSPAGTSFHWLQAGAISPDGRMMVFVTVSGGQSQLWVRRLDRAAARPLPGTEGATAPFWSPDNRFVAFFGDRKLKKVSISGGSPQVLCDAAAGRGGAWSPRGVIVFAPAINGNLFRVTDSGGEPVPLTTFDASRRENAHYWPQFLSDGRRFIYLARSARPELSTIRLGSADATPASQPRIRLVNTLTSAAYVPPGQGFPSMVLFVRNGTLLAQRFNERIAQVEGEPVPVRDGVGAAAFVGLSDFSTSHEGTLVYGSGSNSLAHLTWWSREGRQLGNLGPPGTYLAPKLSPDGSLLAVTRADPKTGNADVWIMDSSRNSESRFTFDQAFDFHPVWSPDGKRILYSSNRSGAFNLFEKEVTGRTPERQLSRTDQTQLAEDWSRDGRFALFLDQWANTAQDLWIVRLQLPAKPFPFARTGSSKRNGQFSPNGHWIAYDSDETGSYQVYVQAFSGEEGSPGAKWQISASGGSQPRWRSDGREIFYLGADRKLMSVEVSEPTSTFQAATPQTLFEAGVLAINDFSFVYDVAPDGKRFLLVTPANQDRAAPLSIVTNFRAQLK